MADRKHSPDVLAELLGAELPPSPAPDLGPSVPAQRARATRASHSLPRESQQAADSMRAKPPVPAAEEASPAWETEIVTFQQHRGWRPHYVNGAELKDWLTGPLIHDYLSRRGAEGWELVGTSGIERFYGAADNLQLYFKRRK